MADSRPAGYPTLPKDTLTCTAIAALFSQSAATERDTILPGLPDEIVQCIALQTDGPAALRAVSQSLYQSISGALTQLRVSHVGASRLSSLVHSFTGERAFNPCKVWTWTLVELGNCTIGTL